MHGQEPLHNLISGLLTNRQLVSTMRRAMVMSLWEQVVGPAAAHRSWAEKVTDGVLTVGVSSHSWAEELNLLKPQILARYRQLLGQSVLKDVLFRVGRRRTHKNDDRGKSLALRPRALERPALQAVPVAVFDGVTNPEVRDVLTPFFARIRAERERKREDGWSRCSACSRVFNGEQCPHCGERVKVP